MTAGGSSREQHDSGATGGVPERQEPDFRTLFESAPGSYLVLSADLVVVAASDAYLRDNTTTRAKIVGRGILDIFADNPAEATEVADLRASLHRVTRDRVPDTMAVRRHDIAKPESEGGGFEVRYWSRVNAPAFDTRGALAYIIHKAEDVTEYIQLKQHRAEQQQLTGQLMSRSEQTEADVLARFSELQEANDTLRAGNDAQKHFLLRASHELRTPLNTILGFGELLSFSDITAEHREWMTMMLQAAQQLLRLLDEMVDITRLEAEQLSLSIEAVGVHDVIADALEFIRPLALSRGVHLDPAPHPRTSQYVAADPQRLRQVLLNLLSNAIKYNHPAGKVAITVEQHTGGPVRLSVTDTGRGIPESELGKLFEPFERLDAPRAGIEGTGLGLALSRHLIQMMGGATGVTSTEGQGSTFWIDLPSAEPIAVAQSAIGHDPIVASRAYPAARTVLYVEDMVENLRLVEQVLKQRPSTTVIPAMLAGVGIDLARQHHPDLILLDLNLPDMPGRDVMHQLRTDPATRDIPIVILSADAAQPVIDELLAAGATAYLAKPIRVRRLLQTLDEILGQDSQASPADVALAGQAAAAAAAHPGAPRP